MTYPKFGTFKYKITSWWLRLNRQKFCSIVLSLIDAQTEPTAAHHLNGLQSLGLSENVIRPILRQTDVTAATSAKQIMIQLRDCTEEQASKVLLRILNRTVGVGIKVVDNSRKPLSCLAQILGPDGEVLSERIVRIFHA